MGCDHACAQCYRGLTSSHTSTAATTASAIIGTTCFRRGGMICTEYVCAAQPNCCEGPRGLPPIAVHCQYCGRPRSHRLRHLAICCKAPYPPVSLKSHSAVPSGRAHCLKDPPTEASSARSSAVLSVASLPSSLRQPPRHARNASLNEAPATPRGARPLHARARARPLRARACHGCVHVCSRWIASSI
jgi:hypothetical protein